MSKWCPRCRTDKPLDAFPRNRSRADGLHSTCKPCASASAWDYQKRKRTEKRARDIAVLTNSVQV